MRSPETFLALGVVVLLFLFVSLGSVSLVSATPSSLAISPSSGPVGTQVTFTGSGFTPNAEVNIYYLVNTEWIMKISATDGAGSFVSGPFTIDGSHGTDIQFIALDYTTMIWSNVVHFNLEEAPSPDIWISPTGGRTNVTILITGTNFTPYCFVGIFYQSSRVMYFGSGSGGSFTKSFIIPLDAPLGANVFTAYDYTSNTWSNDAVYTVTSQQQTGTLKVDTTPVKGWVYVNGVSWGTAPKTKELDVGTYTVSFGSVAGYIAPSDQTITLAAGETRTVVGTYTAIPQEETTLSVGTTPIKGEVFVDGASWGLAPQTKSVEPGTYTISFGDVEDYTAPANQVVTLAEGETKTVIGTYALIEKATLTVDTTPIKGYVFIDGVLWGTAPQTGEIIPGTYTISFGDVEGYVTPPDNVVTLADGEEKSMMGTYEEEISPILTVSPENGPVETDVTFTGSDFTPDAEVNIYYLVGPEWIIEISATDDNGCFTSSPYEIDNLHGTDIQFVALDYTTMIWSNVVHFIVTDEPTPHIEISPTEGSTNVIITITGTYFTPNCAASIFYRENRIRYIFVDNGGNFTVSFTIPSNAPMGANEFVAYDHTSDVFSNEVVYTVTSQETIIPILSISPIAGLTNTPITFTGSDFTLNGLVQVATYDSLGTIVVIAPVYADNTGAFETTVNPWSMLDIGKYVQSMNFYALDVSTGIISNEVTFSIDTYTRIMRATLWTSDWEPIAIFRGLESDWPPGTALEIYAGSMLGIVEVNIHILKEYASTAQEAIDYTKVNVTIVDPASNIIFAGNMDNISLEPDDILANRWLLDRYAEFTPKKLVEGIYMFDITYEIWNGDRWVIVDSRVYRLLCSPPLEFPPFQEWIPIMMSFGVIIGMTFIGLNLSRKDDPTPLLFMSFCGITLTWAIGWLDLWIFLTAVALIALATAATWSKLFGRGK